MRWFARTRAWIVGPALLSLSLVGLIGCGAAPELTSPVADDTTQRTAVPLDAAGPEAGGSDTSQPVADPASPSNPAGDMDDNGKIDLADQDAYVSRFDEAFGKGTGNAAYDPMLDMNGDGVIGWIDLQDFLDLMN